MQIKLENTGIASLAPILALLFWGTSCTETPQPNNPNTSGEPVKNIGGKVETTKYDLSVDKKTGLSKAIATMILGDGSKIEWQFFTEKAPNTVRRITHLISTGFYNNTVFHRVIDGFVVQGGDPTGTGTGGSGENINAEFNDIKHVLGIVSMARAQDANSADSQFFMMTGTHTHLDKSYTGFGKVVTGEGLLKKIKKGDKIKTFTIK